MDRSCPRSDPMSVRQLVGISVLSVVTFAGRAAAEVDFAKEIQPLLEANCLKCHGADTAKAGLRLDSKKALMDGSKKNENVVVPGKADESILYNLVSAAKTAKERMPPEGDPLPK